MGRLRLEDIEVGTVLPERAHCPDNVQLFLYNAALWNAHRIHFDAPYATEVEGYPGLVIAGPLMGDWLTQAVLEWLGDAGSLARLSYSNRQAAYVGETLHAGGVVTAVDRASGRIEIDLHVRNATGENITPGTAQVVFEAAADR
jgi:hydroxyacyl-ACP dehydratase HTD2-like protein with hotdog domain